MKNPFFSYKPLNDNIVHLTCRHFINKGSLLNQLTVPLKLDRFTFSIEEIIVSNSVLPRSIVPTYSKPSDSPKKKCSLLNLGSELGQPEPNRNSSTSDKSFVLQKQLFYEKWLTPEINWDYLANTQQFLADLILFYAILGHFFCW